LKESMLPLDRMWVRSARARLWRWLVDEIVHAPLEPILHPSQARLQWLGAFTVLGHLSFAWIWGYVMPQPFESVPLRLAIACLGVPLLLTAINRDLTSRITIWTFSLVSWLQLPLYFSWMYFMNGGNAVWFSR
jgi:two-component system, CAI-1 autoinducer sensor kinase/phosphatase CqsS